MRPSLVNLCFHGVGAPRRELEPGESRYWIDVPTFHGVLDEVTGRGDVRISFDDGNLSDLDIGLPALVDRGLTATFFVLAGRLGEPGSLDADAVRELSRHGMRIGTHGMDHVPWRGLDATGCHRELVEARERLQDVTCEPVEQAALPLGRYDRQLLGRLRRLGYTTVFTSDRRWTRDGRWLQPRFSVRADDTVGSVRAQVKGPAPLPTRVRLGARGLAKSLR